MFRGDHISLHAQPTHDLLPLFAEECLWVSEPVGLFEECIDSRMLKNELTTCLPFIFGTKWISVVSAETYIHMEYFFQEVLPSLEGIFHPHKTSIVRIDHKFLEACGWPSISKLMGFSNDTCEIHCCEFKQYLSRFGPLVTILNDDQQSDNQNDSHAFFVQLILHPRYLIEKYQDFQRTLRLRLHTPSVHLRTSDYSVKYTGDVFLEEMGTDSREVCEEQFGTETEKTLPSLQRKFNSSEGESNGNVAPSQRLAKLRPLLANLTERYAINPSAELQNRIQTIEKSIWRLVNDRSTDGQIYSTPSPESAVKLADTAESHFEKHADSHPVYHMLGSS
ncbi:hypothetical protein XU18_3502 [Perkinsela sp. CCAP 1560/4]|nr:hypothetical protein XU18_3502 [Perkinsela sp. CCAP 1560/4]|eukprot:KNH05531.1 hypothetical protein XU18_3502 [Perkinsela sp. CCAP 1560/4]